MFTNGVQEGSGQWPGGGGGGSHSTFPLIMVALVSISSFPQMFLPGKSLLKT